MKKKNLALVLITIFISVPIYLQYWRMTEGYSSIVESSKNGYIENVSIVSNKLFITNKEKFAEQIIQDITDNTLKGIMFSYDIQGYPNGLYITVYMNNASYNSGKSSFEISYSQDRKYGFQYNIKDNPEKFTLKIIPQ
jgi:hypothetical protein